MDYLAVFVLLGAISGSMGCAPIPCHWREPDMAPFFNYFNDVANKVIAADRVEKTFCENHASPQIKEIHEVNEYKIIVATSGNGIYDVKVKNRVLVVFATKCDQKVTEIKVLPPYVDAYRATWANQPEGLVISIPYKWDVKNGGTSCADPRRDAGTIFQRTSCRFGDCRNKI